MSNKNHLPAVNPKAATTNVAVDNSTERATVEKELQKLATKRALTGLIDQVFEGTLDLKGFFSNPRKYVIGAIENETKQIQIELQNLEQKKALGNGNNK
jgi:hypothetical protein